MVHLSLRCAAALQLAVLVAQAHAAPLTLDEALHLAQARSRQMPALEAAAAAAREMAVAAARRPDPVLKVGVNNLPVDGPDRFSLTSDFMTMRSIGVVQEWTLADKLEARSARYAREAEVAEADRLVVWGNLQRDTAVAWFERYYLERMRELLVRQREEAQLQLQGAEAAYRGGRGGQADVFAARSAVAQIDDRVASAQRDLASATTMLERWVGTGTGQALAEPPTMETVRLREEDIQTALEHHPQLALMRSQEAVARAQVDAARADRRPDVSVELMYSQRGSEYSNMVSFNVSMPLQWDQKNRQDRELAVRLASVEQMRALREEETRAHAAEARALLQQWRADRDRLKRYGSELLPLAADRTRAALAAYRGGSAPLSAVLEARRAEIDTRMEQLRLELDTSRRWAQLNYLAPTDPAGAEVQQ